MLDEDDDAHQGKYDGKVLVVHEEKGKRDGRGGDQSSQGRISEDESDRDPDCGENQRNLPHQASKDSEVSGHAFAALETEPDRKEMPEEGKQARDDRRIRSVA